MRTLFMPLFSAFRNASGTHPNALISHLPCGYTMSKVDGIATKLGEKAYQGDIKPLNPRQKVTDEDLLKLFSTIEGRYYEVCLLKEMMEGIIKVNDEDMSRSAISSTYLRRLSRFTKKRWRQKKAKGEEGELLLKVYVDGKYVERGRKK